MATVPTISWDETSPAGSQSIKLGDDRIREFKTQVREVIGVDHDFPSSGQATDNGQHLRCTLQEQADLGTGAVGTTILGNQTASGKGELVYTDEDDNDVQITSGGALALLTTATKTALINLIYPVGTVLTFGVSTNPNTLFGVGTWTAIEGKVIVGISSADIEFDTLNETGGSKSVTLTAAQSGLPAHSHTFSARGDDGQETGAGYGVVGYNLNIGAGSGGMADNTAANASEAHTNLQPYIVKYVWERTA